MPQPSEFLRAVTFSQVWEELMSKLAILEGKEFCVENNGGFRVESAGHLPNVVQARHGDAF